jgi:arginase family enzyme
MTTSGIDGTIALIRERVGDLPVYVSLDLDVLDTTYRTGRVEP